MQLTKGLKSLHDRSILHRDLKSANVFMQSDGTFILGDLNVSKITQQDGLLYTQTGTPFYASPEVWRDQPYNNKSDIWSLGCVIYEMTTLNPPFKSVNMDGLYRAVLSGSYPKIPEYYSEELSRVIRHLLQVNPAKRPSCDQILSSKLIQTYFSNQLETLNDYCHDGTLLKTIYVPKNLNQLSDLLPKSKYEEVNKAVSLPKQSFERSKSTQKVERRSFNSTKNVVE